MTPRAHRILLALQLLFFIGWGLRAILLDRQPSGADAFAYQTLRLHADINAGSMLPWLFGLGYKGPAAPLLAYPLALLTGQMLLACRLVSLAAHGLALLASFALARALIGRATAGQWAVLLLGSNQMVFGWARMDFQESLLALLVTATLLFILRLRLFRRRQALLLGALMGVGILTKLGFIPFMVVPGLWLVWRHGRHLRTLPSVLITATTAAAVAAIWAWPNAGWIYRSVFMVSHPGRDLLGNTRLYLSHGATWGLLVAALLSAVVIWRRYPAARRTAMLLGLFVSGSTALFALLFDYWSRYLLPVYPAAAALAGAGVVLASERLPVNLARATGALLAVSQLLPFVQLNLAPEQGWTNRAYNFGLYAPDRRRFVGLPQTVRALQPPGGQVLVIVEGAFPPTRFEGHLELWQFRGLELWPLTLDQAESRLAAGTPVPAVLVSDARPPEAYDGGKRLACPAGDSPPIGPGSTPQSRWLALQKRRCVAKVIDLDGLAYRGYWLE